ncbi:cytochrome C oxidase assembly protein [Janibacter sp. Soil728]|uniref:cytochrome d ubiquinol oxidase subunit II n=1 Tax=Janibacter sp. Soil728 TaxID=1736393 RepID=UPI000700270D|nr:cytochrome d ubiquinol oxidase subunit II [Janibacter sp. Soil728]KRE39454.1 cytochrome C oxidase assembly protein [Janibacter sp. Soil728]
MDLITVWFVLLAVLWTGYLVLEGFDFGVGMLLPVLEGKGSEVERDDKRRTMLTTIGPHWDGNEVWLLTAGGATFAAFPHWYATMFSGMYLALLLLLVTLILRNMGLEYRHKRTDRLWVRRWDLAIVGGSFIAPFLVGVALTNLVAGLPMTEHTMGTTKYTEFDGSLLSLLTPVALLGGLTVTVLCLAHGAHFLALKTTGEIREQARRIATTAGLVSAVLAVTLFVSLGMQRGTPAAWVVMAVAAVALLAAIAANAKGAEGRAFIGTSATIGLTVVSYFLMLSPNAINGRGDSADLTLAAAASSPMTLTIMTWAAAVFTPIMIGYTLWSYWIFRRRLSVEHLPQRHAVKADVKADAEAEAGAQASAEAH